MAITFPTSPADGDVYSYAGITYRYKATRSSWDADRQHDAADIARDDLTAYINERVQDNVAYKALFLPDIVQLGVNPAAASDSPTNPLAGESFRTMAGAFSWLRTQRLRAGVVVQVNLSAGTHIIDNLLTINTTGIGQLTVIGQSAAPNTANAAALVPNASVAANTTAMRNSMSTTTTVQFTNAGRIRFESGDRVTLRNIYFTKAAGASSTEAFITGSKLNLMEVRECNFYSLKGEGTAVRFVMVFAGDCIRVDVRSCLFADINRSLQIGNEAVITDVVVYNCSETVVAGVGVKLDATRLYAGMFGDGVRLIASSLRLNSCELHRSLTLGNVVLTGGHATISGGKLNSGMTGLYAINACIFMNAVEVSANTRKGINIFNSQLYMNGGSLVGNVDLSGTGGGRGSNSSMVVQGVVINNNLNLGWEVAAGSSLSLFGNTGNQATSSNVPVNTVNPSLGWVTNSL